MSASIPWAASASFFGGDKHAPNISTLRGCVRAWLKMPPHKRATAVVGCSSAVKLPEWPDPSPILTPGELEQLAIHLTLNGEGNRTPWAISWSC